MSIYEDIHLERTQQKTPSNGRLSVITIASNILQDNLRCDPTGELRLWRRGGWSQPLPISEVMLEANKKLKNEGRKQITLNPSWVV